jgi:hypothetical protein
MPNNINMKALDNFSSNCEPAVLRGMDFAIVGTVELSRYPPFHRDKKYMHRECKSEAVK